MLVEVPCAYFTRVHSCVCEATFAEVGSRKRSSQKIAATVPPQQLQRDTRESC